MAVFKQVVGERFARLGARLLRVSCAGVAGVEGGRVHLVGASGSDISLSPLSEFLCRRVVETGEALVVEDARECPGVGDLAAGERSLLAFLGVPVGSPSGAVRGVLWVAQATTRLWEADEVDALQDLAAAAGAEWDRIADSLQPQPAQHPGGEADRAGLLGSSVEQLAEIVDSAADFVGIAGVHGELRYLNRSGRGLLGLEDDAALSGLSIFGCYPAWAQELLREQAFPAALDAGVWRGETALLTCDGREIPVLQVVQCHRSPATGAVEFLSTIACDISQRKRTEITLTRSRDFYLTLFDKLPAMIRRSDRTGASDYFNTTWLEFSGRSLQDELGEGWLEEVHPDDRQRCRSAYTTALHTREPFGLEYRLRHHSGDYRWIFDIGRPFYDYDGTFMGYIGCCFDVTERRTLEDQVRQAQKMDAVGRLAGGIAHDFNNLLNVIGGNAELALLDLPDNDPVREDLDEIVRASTRAAELTQQLLAFSRKQVLQLEVLDLNSIVVEVERMLGRLIREDIELVTRLQPGLGRVKADPGQLHQVLMNLAVNARDAMPNGGVLRISTRDVTLDSGLPDELAPGEYVELAVQDTGQGMSPEMQEQIFEPFFTTKERGKGTGLGLSTVYGIISQSGGHIRVESRPGQGATFRILLPRAGDASALSSPDAEELISVSGGQTILLVEDEDGVRSLLHRVLERGGFKVLPAENGEQALMLAQMHATPIHLLLTDVIMPRMNGRVLAERLTERLPGLKVLYISGYTDDAIAHHGVLEPGTHLVHKPVQPAMLIRKIQDILEPSP